MNLSKNPKIKSTIYFLIFILAVILGGYVFYFTSYIPSREVRLNDEAISTIRNIRDGIIRKEAHYKQLLQSSHDLDEILVKKTENLVVLENQEISHQEFIDSVATIYIQSNPNFKRDSIISKVELRNFIILLEDQIEKMDRKPSKRFSKKQPSVSLSDQDKLLRSLVNFLDTSTWESQDFVFKNINNHYERDSLEIAYVTDKLELKKLSYPEIYQVVLAEWNRTIQSIATNNTAVNFNLKDSILGFQALLSDVIIASNYRDGTLHILDKESSIEIDENSKLKTGIHNLDDHGKNRPTLFTIKQGLERKIIITKKNNHLDEKEPLSGIVSMEDFMAGVTDSKLFDCVVLFDNSTIFYTNEPRILSKQSADSLSHFVDNNLGIDIREHMFNGKPYMQYTAPISIGNEAFHITGLIESAAYTSYTKGVQYHVLIIILLLTMFLISIVPSVKIFVITEWERLKTTDVTFAGIGIMLGVFVLCLLLLTIGHYSSLKNETKTQLTNWNDSIQASMQLEIYQSISELQNPMYTPASSRETIFHEYAILDNSGFVVDLHLPYGKDSKVNTTGAYFTEIGKATNLSKRKYFNGFASQENYRFIQDSLPDFPFYLQPVFSHKRGKKEAVISIENPTNWVSSFKKDKGYVRIRSTDLKSVMLRKVPTGYQYAIIDRSGNILFSSDQEKNGLRNIFAQTVEHGFIGQAMQSGEDMTGTFVHGRQTYLAAISPISFITNDKLDQNTLPLFALTYADKSILTWKTSTASIMLGTIGFILIALFLTMRALFWILRFRHSDGSLTPAHFNRWLAPKTYKRSTYIVFILGCLVALFVLIFTFLTQEIDGVIVIAFMNVFYISGIRYGLLAKPKFACSGYNNAVYRFKSSNAVHWCFYTFFVILLLQIYWTSNQTGIKAGILVWYVVSMIILMFSVFQRESLSNKIKEVVQKIEFKNVNIKSIYITEIVVWISILLITPMMLTAFKSENIVSNTYSRFAYQELSAHTSAQKIAYKSDYHNYMFNKESIQVPYADFSVIGDGHFIMTKEDSLAESNFKNVPSNAITNGLFKRITKIYPLHGHFQPVATINAGVATPYPTNRPLGLWIALIATILLLALAAKAFTRRIFFNIYGLLAARTLQPWPPLLDVLEDQNRFLFVGPPISTRKVAIKEITGKDTPNELVEYNLDFDTIKGIDTDDFDVELYIKNSTKIKASGILIFSNWYAFNIGGHELGNKLTLLTRLLDMTENLSKPVILLSSATTQQLETYIKGKSFEKNASFNSRVYFKHFKSVFKRFHEVVFPIDMAQLKSKYREQTKSLQTMLPGEKLLIKAQYLTPTYVSIWNSLSPEEKFVLYDISDDGMVNNKNWDTILLLKRKGIIKYDEEKFAFECFDEAFAYYVTQSISQEEALEMENIAKKKGSWVPIKIALILIVVALFGLVYNFNPSVLQGFVGILSGIATAVAAFGRIGTSLRNPFAKTK